MYMFALTSRTYVYLKINIFWQHIYLHFRWGITGMSNKKNRNKEKREQKRIDEETKVKETKSRKGKALVNMAICLSLLLLFYVSQFMGSTFDQGSKLPEVSGQLNAELNIKDATALSIVPSNNSMLILYEKDNKVGVAKGTPHSIMNFRYTFESDFGLTDKKLNYKILNDENSNATNIIVYGDLKDTLASKVEVTFNGETKVHDIVERNKFLITLDFKKASSTDISIKVIDKDNKDITSEL